MTQIEKLTILTRALLNEYENGAGQKLPETETELFKVYRSLVNVRLPKEAPKISAFASPDGFYKLEADYLQSNLKERGTVTIADMESFGDGIYLWRGDITRIECDAIVNAANAQLLGCFVPGHACIDNCIHTFAGIELRNECLRVIQKQGHEEGTGLAKITSGYNLPAKHVIHTVGPIVHGKLTAKNEELLESSYANCLKVAAENGCKSIAFCCISTGVFHFPLERASEIAIATVKKHKPESMQAIFNVFSERDENVYRKKLSE